MNNDIIIACVALICIVCIPHFLGICAFYGMHWAFQEFLDYITFYRQETECTVVVV